MLAKHVPNCSRHVPIVKLAMFNYTKLVGAEGLEPPIDVISRTNYVSTVYKTASLRPNEKKSWSPGNGSKTPVFFRQEIPIFAVWTFLCFIAWTSGSCIRCVQSLRHHAAGCSREGFKPPVEDSPCTAKANTRKQPVCGGCSSTPNTVVSHLTWNLVRMWNIRNWNWRQSFEDSYPNFCVRNCPTHMLSRWKPGTWTFQRLKPGVSNGIWTRVFGMASRCSDQAEL